MLLRMLATAAEYDQLDLVNCAWAELAFRHLQVVEWVYCDRIKEMDGYGSGGPKGSHKGGGSLVAAEEIAAFTGSMRGADMVMVCASLLDHVKKTTEQDGSIMKTVRMARQERQARRSGKDPKDGE